MILSAHQPQYLPWIGFFAKILESDCFVFLDSVQYKKREFQNRNKIRTKDGWIWLTIPVVCKNKSLQSISEVRINNDIAWQRKHLKSLIYAYKDSKHFDEHIIFFKEIYNKKFEKLIDINLAIIYYFLEQFSINTKLFFESELDIKGKKTERIINICKKLGADTYLSGIGGKEYLDEELFKKEKINLIYQNFKHPVYKQMYEPFIPFMSAVDLLFNYGKDLKILLKI